MAEKMINLKINGIAVSVPEGTTILEAARQIGIKIPTLCYLKEINEIGACRICVVDVKGARNMVASCVNPVSEGMEVTANSKKVYNARKVNLELLLSNHNKNCTGCVRSTNCELQRLSQEYGCDSDNFSGDKTQPQKDESTSYIVRDSSKCILCKRCTAVCSRVQDVGVIGPNKRGFNTHIGCAFEKNLKDVPCVACGQCTVVCPTGALVEKDDIDDVLAALSNPEKICIAAMAPSVRVGIGEEFGFPSGTNLEKKTVAALKLLGFNQVFDVNVAADLTIMEEAAEFIDRFTKNKNLPLITSCSPGWIKYVESYFPNLLNHVSSCKSPQQMMGAIIKTYYAQKNNIKPENLFVVSVMPCTAKKFERNREHQNAAGVQDIDAVLTVRELARLIKRAGINFNGLKDREFDNPFGIASGAGLIFGASGGVMEAALRTAVEKITGKPLDNLDFKDVRGMQGIKEATYNVAGTDVNVCVVSGIANAKKILKKISNGEANYHFVEIMTCPGGCVSGGGQPVQSGEIYNFDPPKEKRAAALYTDDKKNKIRKSHENPVIKQIYEEFLGSPNSEKAHHILHTKYTVRKKYN